MKDDILNILADYSGRGRAPAPWFSKRTEVRERFAEIALDIATRIGSGPAPLQREALVALVRKLAAHCQKAGWQQLESIDRLAALAVQIVDAVIEKPQMLTEPVNLSGMLTAHASRCAGRRACLAGEAATRGDPPSTVLKHLPDGCTLVELVAPAHLQEESRALGHCVGTLFNERALAAKSLRAGDPGALRYLQHAIKIRAGDSRIFSLRSRLGEPLATISYDVREEAIVEVEGSGGDLRGQRPLFLPALCEALYQLSGKLSVTDMPYLGSGLEPQRELGGHGIVLTRDGREERASEVDPAEALTGRVTVSDDTPQRLLDRWARMRCLTVDISFLSNRSRLPPHIAGNLTGRDRAAGMPRLESACRLHFGSAECLYLPQLRALRDLWAPCLRRLVAPRLEAAGRVYARSARSFGLPPHTRVEEPSHSSDYEHGFQAAAEQKEAQRRQLDTADGSCPCGARRRRDCAAARI